MTQLQYHVVKELHMLARNVEQVAFQSNANHPLVESMGYIKFVGM